MMRLLFTICLSFSFVSQSEAFSSRYTGTRRRLEALSAKAKKLKQTDLKRLYEEAQQRNGTQRPEKEQTAEEIKERNDRLRFEELLKNAPVSMSDAPSDGYLTKEQEDEEISAARRYYEGIKTPSHNIIGRGVERLFEGDPAPTECFAGLTECKSGNLLGDAGAQSLVPWLGKYSDDYLIIITDARLDSTELQNTAQNIVSDLPMEIRNRIIIVNADSPSANRRWLKKAGLTTLRVYSDMERAFMKEYTALGETRLSMCMFLVQNERMARIVREMDEYGATKAIRNSVKSL